MTPLNCPRSRRSADMSTIQVRFIATDGLISGIIRKVTGSLFSHVEFGTPEGTWIGARFQGGVEERPANYCKPTREYIYDIPATDAQAKMALAWMRSKIGTKYNTRDIAGLMLQARSLRSPNRLICSQFYAEGMLRIFGAERFLNVASGWEYRITPEMGHLSPMLVGHLVKRIG